MVDLPNLRVALHLDHQPVEERLVGLRAARRAPPGERLVGGTEQRRVPAQPGADRDQRHHRRPAVRAAAPRQHRQHQHQRDEQQHVLPDEHPPHGHHDRGGEQRPRAPAHPEHQQAEREQAEADGERLGGQRVVPHVDRAGQRQHEQRDPGADPGGRAAQHRPERQHEHHPRRGADQGLRPRAGRIAAGVEQRRAPQSRRVPGEGERRGRVRPVEQPGVRPGVEGAERLGPRGDTQPRGDERDDQTREHELRGARPGTRPPGGGRLSRLLRALLNDRRLDHDGISSRSCRPCRRPEAECPDVSLDRPRGGSPHRPAQPVPRGAHGRRPSQTDSQSEGSPT